MIGRNLHKLHKGILRLIEPPEPVEQYNLDKLLVDLHYKDEPVEPFKWHEYNAPRIIMSEQIVLYGTPDRSSTDGITLHENTDEG